MQESAGQPADGDIELAIEDIAQAASGMKAAKKAGRTLLPMASIAVRVATDGSYAGMVIEVNSADRFRSAAMPGSKAFVSEKVLGARLSPENQTDVAALMSERTQEAARRGPGCRKCGENIGVRRISLLSARCGRCCRRLCPWHGNRIARAGCTLKGGDADLAQGRGHARGCQQTPRLVLSLRTCRFRRADRQGEGNLHCS